jgi:exodeoxyribonuclease VII large subunit
MKMSKKNDIYNVTRLNREVRAVLEGSFPELWVQGEISNLAQPASGHIYFSLKDRNSQVRCAMFKGRNRTLKFTPENGLEVLIRANVSLYEGRGEFQLIVEAMEPAGEGALQRAFEELKLKLHDEGLFDEENKQPLPDLPRCIGIITSPTGAAIRDVLHVLKRRYPLASVIVFPVLVQGDGAAAEITRAVKLAEKRKECDVIILTRGGGSLEDLWAFNDESLARTIHQIKTPLVSGVGHEIDFTIADFVADHRAPTPSAAAEMVTPDKIELLAALSSQENHLSRTMSQQLATIKTHLQQLEKRLPHPARQLQYISQRLDDQVMHLQKEFQILLNQKQAKLSRYLAGINKNNPIQQLGLYKQKNNYLLEQLKQRVTRQVDDVSNRLKQLSHNLEITSPLATLDRGYAIISNDENMIVRQADTLKPGETITARVSQGKITSKVIDIEKK